MIIAGSFEDRLKITSQFALIGGVRVEDFRLARDGVNFDGTIPTGLPFTKTWTPVSYRAAYTYEPIPDLTFYSMYATAYDPAVAGIFSLNPGNGPLQLTSARTYETGAKQILWDGRAEWTVALYDIRPAQCLCAGQRDGDRYCRRGLHQRHRSRRRRAPDSKALSSGAMSRSINRASTISMCGRAIRRRMWRPSSSMRGASYRFDHWRWPVEFGGSVRHVGNRFLFQDNLTTLDAYTTADAYAFVDIPGRDLPWRPVENRASHVPRPQSDQRGLCRMVRSGLPDQILLGAPRTYEVAASAKW